MRILPNPLQGATNRTSDTKHWLRQRLTAAMLVPLSILFATLVFWLTGESHSTVTSKLRTPIVGIPMLFLIILGLYHFKLGMQVILEDYIHTDWLKTTSVSAVTLISIALAFGCALSLLSLMFEL